jgi:ribonuclease HII
VAAIHRIGVDENGLGARLGPMVVTAVLARVDEGGARMLARRLPKAIRSDLDDSKRLVSHSDFGLGEAWARAVVDGACSGPRELLGALLHEPESELSAPCPSHVKEQCWSTTREGFLADDALCERIRGHVATFAARGVTILRVRSSVLCTKRLNQAKERGINRFVADLHAMESLLLSLRGEAGSKVQAVCGKVGGINEYERFFGPLSGHLRTALEVGSKKSSYYFPALGEVSFVCDADASDPIVMLASLIGKYVRELLMARIVRFYPAGKDDRAASGYHDPLTRAFVERTALLRRQRKVPLHCFERARDEAAPNAAESAS